LTGNNHRVAPYYGASLRSASPRNSTQGFVMYNSTQRFVCYFAPHRPASRRSSPLFNAIQRYDLFISFRASTRSDLARRVAAPRNATICLLQRLSTRLGFSQGTTAPRRAPRLNSTQRFVCQFIIAPRHGSRQRTAAQLALPRRAATQLNDLFVNLFFATRLRTTKRNKPRHNVSPRISTQRTET
jgi:hypothetical protein